LSNAGYGIMRAKFYSFERDAAEKRLEVARFGNGRVHRMVR
jgi:hypothetical protein